MTTVSRPRRVPVSAPASAPLALSLLAALSAVLVPAASPAAGFDLASLFQRGERGSGTVVEHEFPVEDFDRLEFGHAFSVRVRIGSPASVRARIDDNLVDKLRVEVRGGTLVLATDERIRPTTARFEIVTPRLEGITASGASHLDLDRYEGRSLTLTLSGASSADVSGRVEELQVQASGASEARLADLAAVRVQASASGASELDLQATAGLSATASGASRIRYAGEPEKRDVHTSGASEIRQR